MQLQADGVTRSSCSWCASPNDLPLLDVWTYEKVHVEIAFNIRPTDRILQAADISTRCSDMNMHMQQLRCAHVHGERNEIKQSVHTVKLALMYW
jgi:hypothetical protein